MSQPPHGKIIGLTRHRSYYDQRSGNIYDVDQVVPGKTTNAQQKHVFTMFAPKIPILLATFIHPAYILTTIALQGNACFPFEHQSVNRFYCDEIYFCECLVYPKSNFLVRMRDKAEYSNQICFSKE